MGAANEVAPSSVVETARVVLVVRMVVTGVEDVVLIEAVDEVGAVPSDARSGSSC